MKKDFFKIVKDFIINEGKAPHVNSYIQSLSEMLEFFAPKTVSDMRRLEIAKENLMNIRRHVRKMEEKVSMLEEQLKVLQEEKSKK